MRIHFVAILPAIGEDRVKECVMTSLTRNYHKLSLKHKLGYFTTKKMGMAVRHLNVLDDSVLLRAT